MPDFCLCPWQVVTFLYLNDQTSDYQIVLYTKIKQLAGPRLSCRRSCCVSLNAFQGFRLTLHTLTEAVKIYAAVSSSTLPYAAVPEDLLPYSIYGSSSLSDLSEKST